jgi:hypothetical protein
MQPWYETKYPFFNLSGCLYQLNKRGRVDWIHPERPGKKPESKHQP